MAGSIVLAAGRSTRFGTDDKLLARLTSGERVIERCLETVSSICPEPVVVIRPDNAPLADIITAAGFTPLPCPDADLGMGHSLAFGAAQIPQGQAILVMLADLPFVRRDTLTHLLLTLTDDRQIVIPSYHGCRGHPVLFGSVWRKRLLNLTGDTGARTVIHDPKATVIELPVDDVGTVHDIDTPSALAAFAPPSD